MCSTDVRVGVGQGVPVGIGVAVGIGVGVGVGVSVGVGVAVAVGSGVLDEQAAANRMATAQTRTDRSLNDDFLVSKIHLLILWSCCRTSSALTEDISTLVLLMSTPCCHAEPFVGPAMTFLPISRLQAFCAQY